LWREEKEREDEVGRKFVAIDKHAWTLDAGTPALVPLRALHPKA